MTFGKNLPSSADSHKRTSLATAGWYDPAVVSDNYTYFTGSIWVGRSLDGRGRPIGYEDDRHICLVAGTRGGKGASFIINNICHWPGSCVVLDPKGENATVTARRRGKGSDYAEGIGQSVHVLDPFNVVDLPDSYKSSFNPLDFLDPESGDVVDEAARLADALIITGQSKEPFWEESARELVKGIILHVITTERFSSDLVTVRGLITSGDWETYDLMEKHGDKNIPSAHKLLLEEMSHNMALGGVIRGIGATFLNSAIESPRTFQSVLQTAVTQTEFLDSEGLRRILTKSDFALSDLKTDPDGVSIYLALPQRYMNTHFRWYRMMVTMTITEMEKVRAQPASGHPVLMIMDEFAGLKRMEIIENAVAQMAGFGVKLFYIVQTLPQLKSIYQDNWETLIANAGLKIFFDLDDQFSRDYVSRLIGETEVIRDLESSNRTEGRSENYSEGASHSYSKSRSMSHSTSFGSTTTRGSSSGGGPGGSHYGSSSSTSHSSSHSTSQTEGSSETLGTSTTRGHGTSESQTRGISQNLQKTLLITPDEIGRMFARVDDENSDYYPGLALILVTGQPPFPVRRSYYFEDIMFCGCFDPHPDHPAPPYLEESIQIVGPSEELLKNVSYGRTADTTRLRKWFCEEGDYVRKGAIIAEVGPFRNPDEIPKVTSPVSSVEQKFDLFNMEFSSITGAYKYIKRNVKSWFSVAENNSTNKTSVASNESKPYSPFDNPKPFEEEDKNKYISLYAPACGRIETIHIEEDSTITSGSCIAVMSMNRRKTVQYDRRAFDCENASDYFGNLNQTVEVWELVILHSERLREAEAAERARISAEQAQLKQDKKARRQRILKTIRYTVIAIVALILLFFGYKYATENQDDFIGLMAFMGVSFGAYFLYHLYRKLKS